MPHGAWGTSSAVGLGVACAGALALTAATTVIGAHSSIVDHRAVFLTLRATFCVGTVLIAVVTLARRRNERMVAMLVASSAVLALGGLTADDSPLPFAIGRIAATAGVLVVTYVCLAYPSGRIEDPTDSRFLTAWTAGLLALLTADLLLSRIPPVAGPFVRCGGSACPHNPLNVVALASGPSNALSSALGVATALTAGAAAVLVARRAAISTPLQRRGIAPLLAWAILAGLGFGFYVGVRALDQHARLLTPAAEVVVAIIALMPFAVGFGIIRGRVFAMSALEHMIGRLGDRPGLAELEQVVADEFGDPKLQLLVWRPPAQRFVDINGVPVEFPADDRQRTVTRFSRDNEPLAALIHDPVLSDEVLDAIGSAVRIALDNARLQTDLAASIRELEASRERLASAADQERRRIEQDLHDGAQQGLIALRFKLQLLLELAVESPEALVPGLADAGKRVDATLEAIRGLAKGVYPAVLGDLGLASALGAAIRELPVDVAVHTNVQGRFRPELETAMYFSCTEALQNVAKHCPRARADLYLSEQPDALEFVLSDEGPGFDPTDTIHGRGITGMRDRLEAVGGQLTITSVPGQGSSVTGRVPARSANRRPEGLARRG